MNKLKNDAKEFANKLILNEDIKKSPKAGNANNNVEIRFIIFY